jgi:hypothetical protein
VTRVSSSGRVWLILASFALLAAAPLWIAPHLPPQDLPNHLSMMATLARDGEPGWHERFEDRRGLRPYTAFYSPAVALVRAVGIDAAGRLLLTLYVVLLPLSLAAVLHVWRPGTELAGLLAIPLSYSDIYLMGFINFLFSLPLLFFAVALGLATLRGGPRSVPFACALCVCLLLACYTHPVSMALFALFAASWLVFTARDRRSLFVFAAGCLPAAGVFLAWFVQSAAETGWRISSMYKLSYLLTTPAFLLDAGGVPEARWVMAGVVALALGASVVAARSRLPGNTSSRSLGRLLSRDRAAWLGFLAVLALYWVMPFARGATVWADLRLAPVVWMLLIVCVAGSLVASRTLIVLGAATLAVYWVGAVRVHQAFSREVAPLFELIEELPEDARLLPILLDPRSVAIYPSHLREQVIRFSSPYTHFASWYHLEKRGESPHMAFHYSMPMLPVALKSPFYRHRFGVGGAFGPSRLLGELRALAPKFDFIVVRAKNLQGIAAIEEVASLYASAPPFYAFAVTR